MKQRKQTVYLPFNIMEYNLLIIAYKEKYKHLTSGSSGEKAQNPVIFKNLFSILKTKLKQRDQFSCQVVSSVMWKAPRDISSHDQMHQSIPSATAQQIILLNCVTDHSSFSLSSSFRTLAVREVH